MPTAAPTPVRVVSLSEQPLGTSLPTPVERLTGRTLEGLATSWGREPLLRRAAELPTDLTDLFGPDALDELVSRRGLRTPFLRVAKSGSDIPTSRWTRGGGTGATVDDQVSDDDLLALLADGATLIGQGLHRTWPPLVDFCQALMAQIGHPVQANAYLTPPQNRGFDPHFDVHDVFVVQVSGRKRWIVHRPVIDVPLRTQEWRDLRPETAARAEEEPYLDFVLETGDVLYLPRGWVHSAEALGEVSTHVTLGVHPWTRMTLAQDLLDEALAVLAQDGAVREALPLGLDPREPRPEIADVRAALHAALDEVPDAALLRRLDRRGRNAVRTSPVSPVAQVQAALDLTEATVVRLRAHLRVAVGEEDGRRVLSSRLGSQRVDIAREHVDALVAGRTRTAGELGIPDTRRLLRAGVVVPA